MNSVRIDHPITREQARMVAVSGAQCAAALVQPDGRFTYRTVNGEPVPGYNLLRHCGTVWSIADIAHHLGGMDEAVEAAKRAMKMIIDGRLVLVNSGLCVSGGKATKLGGAGLAILALVALDKFDIWGGYIPIADSLADFILSMRRRDGDFHHKLHLETRRIADFRSDYYTGEALFGLLRLYQATRKRKPLLDAARDSIAKLRARHYGVREQSHWMVYALSTLHEITGDAGLVDYAGEICAHVIEHPDYRVREKSTPIACRTEALMAYADMLRRDEGRTSGPTLDAVMGATVENISLMLRYRQIDGSFVAGRGDPTVQIDYIQHASSAFLGYFRNYHAV